MKRNSSLEVNEANDDVYFIDKKAKVEDGEVSSTVQDEDCQKVIQKNWPEQDLLKLTENIERNIPKGDVISFYRRMDKIDWEKIVFNEYTVEECKQKWITLHKNIRKFRNAKEIVNDVKYFLTTQKKGDVKITSRHPQMPKQPPNAYMLYFHRERPKLKQENPSLSGSEIAKLLGSKFHTLPIEVKEIFEKEALAAKEQYAINLQEFYNNHPQYNKRRSKSKSRSTVEDGAPHRPKTPFEKFLEFEMERQEEEIESKQVFVQKCRETWKHMTDEDIMFWINWVEEEHKVYMEKLQEYIENHPQYEPDEIKSLLTKNEVKIKERCSGKPTKPPLSIYHLFTKMISQTEECKQLSGKDVMNFISNQWKSCSQIEKSEYQTRLDQMWEEYDIAYDAYLKNLPMKQKSEEINQKINRKKKENLTEDPDSDKQPLRSMVKVKPSTPPRTIYDLFLANYKGADSKKAWSKTSSKRKERLQQELDKMKNHYIRDYEEFLKGLSKEDLEAFAKSGSSHSNCSDSSTCCGSSDSDDETSDSNSD